MTNRLVIVGQEDLSGYGRSKRLLVIVGHRGNREVIMGMRS